MLRALASSARDNRAKRAMLTIADIEQARRRIQDAVLLTPCAESAVLSKLTGSTIFLKLESLQLTGSFKERGACNKLLTLTEEQRARGVITASAGNHAQAVAHHASRLGIAATVVMPEPTPLIKVQSTRAFGARVILHGTSYDDAAQRAAAVCESEGAVYVHPFDDALVIAGQGTIGLELLEQNPFLEAVVVPVGGGGLIAGIACAVKETNPRIAVYGVEAQGFPSMTRALEAGAPVTVGAGTTIADGIAVRRVADQTLDAAQRYVDGLAAVDEEEIAASILVLLEREKTVAEGAGAVGLAALLHQRFDLQGKHVAIVLSGGNIDVTLISRIIERGLVKTGRLVRIQVTVPDVAGALARLTRAVADAGANVVEIHHDRAFSDIHLGETEVELVLETRGFEHIDEVGANIERAGYRFVARGAVAS